MNIKEEIKKEIELLAKAKINDDETIPNICS